MPIAAIQTICLTRRYGSLTAVQDLTLEVYEGEVLGLLGPNGAGKTTSIQMISGLLKPDAGQVFIQGKNVSHRSTETRLRVGVCPQNILLWERLTCLEQLQFLGQMYGISSKVSRLRGWRLLEEMGLEDKKDKLARTLSGGMQRRLNLVMALVNDPDIVILDEPEAGLDPQSRIMVREYIRSLARNKTVLFTTQNMDEASRVCDRVAIIDHGKLLVVDTPEALTQRLGEGDLIEIKISGNPEQQEKVRMALTGLDAEANPEGLQIRATHALVLLPEVVQILASLGVQCEDIRLRKNTLEDVFIHLTGRRLRE